MTEKVKGEQVEQLAEASSLTFTPVGDVWTASEAMQVQPFHYRVSMLDEGIHRLGEVDGCRITCVSEFAEEDLWGMADHEGGDLVAYFESLIREFGALRELDMTFSSPSDFSRIMLVRDVRVTGEVSSDGLHGFLQSVVASLWVMDAPCIMVVDPHLPYEARKTPAGKLQGRRSISKLLELGFERMVSSRFVWAWSTELAEYQLEDYDYDALVIAKKSGRLKEVLADRPAERVFGGPLSDEALGKLGISTPEELLEDS